MNLWKYLVLALMILFNAFGDVALSHGMKKMGAIPADRLADAVAAVFTPWVILGILSLLCFFACYLTALSWADLSYVIPATALGYVLIALLSQWLLGETVTLTRWAGILLVGGGVFFLARGPVLTVPEKPREPAGPADAAESRP
ncbi:MAG: EamA family transporter [Terriglobales bacterium]